MRNSLSMPTMLGKVTKRIAEFIVFKCGKERNSSSHKRLELGTLNIYSTIKSIVIEIVFTSIITSKLVIIWNIFYKFSYFLLPAFKFLVDSQDQVSALKNLEDRETCNKQFRSRTLRAHSATILMPKKYQIFFISLYLFSNKPAKIGNHIFVQITRYIVCLIDLATESCNYYDPSQSERSQINYKRI